MNTAYEEITEAQREIRQSGLFVGISAAAIQSRERRMSRPSSLTTGDPQPYPGGADPDGSPLSRFSADAHDGIRSLDRAMKSANSPQPDLAAAAAYLDAAINAAKAARAALAEILDRDAATD